MLAVNVNESVLQCREGTRAIAIHNDGGYLLYFAPAV